LIKLEGAWKSYGSVSIVEGMELTVEEGKPLCILGRSGCGKSTLLKLLALMDRLDKGALSIDGRDVSMMDNAEVDKLRRDKIAYTFQEPLLIPYVTALENVTMVTGVSGEKAAEVLGELGLADRLNYRPQKLSGGERKRVDVARAILRAKPILVADEPLSNLDPKTGSIVMGMLNSHAERGGILVYSAVEPADAKSAAQVVKMERN